jgi:hypothetical protein
MRLFIPNLLFRHLPIYRIISVIITIYRILSRDLPQCHPERLRLALLNNSQVSSRATLACPSERHSLVILSEAKDLIVQHVRFFELVFSNTIPEFNKMLLLKYSFLWFPMRKFSLFLEKAASIQGDNLVINGGNDQGCISVFGR